MVSQLKRHTRSLMQRALYDNDIIHIRVQRLEHQVKLPSASRTLINDKLRISFKRSQWLKSHQELQWFLRRVQILVLLLKEDRPLNEASMLLIEHIDLVSE